MTQKDNSKIISVVHLICCGLDVHKDKDPGKILEIPEQQMSFKSI
jgi:hypothetical protein